ncbi:hypothetical protein AVEN_220173-1 [Araneus ventricosus]|uniref:Uncharacterized protein n=1 Tax=Araneus ventricosus TaxID=182803 RepID=A0A4Y2QKN3_ARAVE|nr:hypothetical protein AVEN_220173-1 [Araneus ventricosus]
MTERRPMSPCLMSLQQLYRLGGHRTVQYGTHALHYFSNNLPVSADIYRNVALIVRCPDDRKSLPGSVASLGQLFEPGHSWKIVFHPNVL